VSPDRVRRTPLSNDERENGTSEARCWVPFEKGDQSQEVDRVEGKTSRIGAAWDRANPLVIEWSREAVALLRRRANASGAQRPYFRNENLWFNEGVTWNRVASYLRTRQVPIGSIFGDKAPLLRPLSWIGWLTPLSLLALLNSNVLDFILRTFLGSRMMIEVGDIRRLVIPVLSPQQVAILEDFASRAVAARHTGDVGLTDVELQLNAFVRDIYGIPRAAELWVVR